MNADRVKKFKALSDESRLKILEVLQQGPLAVSDIVDYLGLAQNLVSHHLKILRQATFIDSTRQGTNIIYSLSPSVSYREKTFDFGCCRVELKDAMSLRR